MMAYCSTYIESVDYYLRKKTMMHGLVLIKHNVMGQNKQTQF